MTEQKSAYIQFITSLLCKIAMQSVPYEEDNSKNKSELIKFLKNGQNNGHILYMFYTPN